MSIDSRVREVYQRLTDGESVIPFPFAFSPKCDRSRRINAVLRLMMGRKWMGEYLKNEGRKKSCRLVAVVSLNAFKYTPKPPIKIPINQFRGKRFPGRT